MTKYLLRTFTDLHLTAEGAVSHFVVMFFKVHKTHKVKR